MRFQYSDPTASFFLFYAYPRLLELAFLSWLALVAVNFKAIVSQFKPLVSRGGAATALALCCAALTVRLFVIPPRHQVYFDEFLHEDIAANIARADVFGESVAGGSEELRRLQTPHWPGGYHVLLGNLFKLTGVSEAAAFRFNAALASLSVGLIFLLCTLLFADQRAGLIGAALLAALPLHIRFSGTTDLTVCSAFWIFAALLSLELHRRLKDHSIDLLFAASVLIAVNVRLENLILAPLVAVAAAAAAKSGALPPERKAGRIVFLILLASSVGLLFQIYAYKVALLNVFANLRVHIPANIRYLIGMPENSLILIPAAIFAACRGASAQKSTLKMLLLLGASYVLVCSVHFQGDFNVGSFEKLAMPAELCLIVAASCGLNRLLGSVRAQKAAFAALLAACVALSWPLYGKGPLERYEQEYRLVVDAAPLLPVDSYVICYFVPIIIVAADRPAVMAPFLNMHGSSLLDTLDQGGLRPLILFKDVWWYKFADSSAPLERRLRTRYRFEPVKTAVIDAQEYGFYRLTRLGTGTLQAKL
ncbi:MAG: hypothetical protein ACHQ2Z_04935 [Elusimicrobiota bacterium]